MYKIWANKRGKFRIPSEPRLTNQKRFTHGPFIWCSRALIHLTLLKSNQSLSNIVRPWSCSDKSRNGIRLSLFILKSRGNGFWCFGKYSGRTKAPLRGRSKVSSKFTGLDHTEDSEHIRAGLIIFRVIHSILKPQTFFIPKTSNFFLKPEKPQTFFRNLKLFSKSSPNRKIQLKTSNPKNLKLFSEARKTPNF